MGQVTLLFMPSYASDSPQNFYIIYRTKVFYGKCLNFHTLYHLLSNKYATYKINNFSNALFNLIKYIFFYFNSFLS